MSDAPATNANESGAAAAQPKKSSKKLIIIILVVLLAGGGVGGFLYMKKASASSGKEEKSSKKSKADKAGEESADTEAETEKGTEKAGGGTSAAKSINLAIPDDEDVKHVIELQPFIVNLADDNEARYFRLTLSIGIGESSSEKPDELFLTRIRNAILAVLTTKKSSEILTIEGKATLRKEILKAAQKASSEPEVLAIYITDFIIQM